MPLFGRRSRSVSVSRPITPSNTSPAMLAASQAFLGNQGAQTKLATGAAAAALRSMSPATTPVSHVQTKRMMERSGSVASHNAQRGRTGNSNLHRRSSSSSMTERTFREPSPSRPASSTGLVAPRREEPPVPPLPESYTRIPPIPQKSQRRSASIDEVQVRKNARTSQPANNRHSVAEYSTPRTPVNPGLVAARRVASSSTAPARLDRTDSNGSHNFSYPGRARPNSPPPLSPTLRAPSSPKPDVVVPRGISQTEAMRIQNQLAQVAQQPTRKKKRYDGPLAEGSHLQTGTMGHKPTITPLAPGPLATEESPTLQKDPNSAKLSGQASHFPPSPASPTDSIDSQSDAEQLASRRAQRASGHLQKQPSVVREDWDGEHDHGTTVLDNSPIPARYTSKPQLSEANVSRKIETTSPRADYTPVAAAPATLSTPTVRNPSLSPSRSAHFSKRLSADITEGQKHEPPPRSVSPRKPALKHVPSPYGLVADRVRDPSVSPSEATDTSTEGGPRRKKKAHVTFNTQPDVVGISAEPDTPVSPTVTSPQNRNKDQRWSAPVRMSQQRMQLSGDSDEDDAMKPRPTLPTFGSVRGQRNETQSLNVQKPASSPSSSSTSSLTSSTGPTTMETSISSDHVIGGLFAQDAEYKSVYSQVLAPQATSPARNKAQNDIENVYSADNFNLTAVQIPSKLNTTISSSTTRAASDVAPVPSIAVQPATPGVQEESKSKDQWLVDVPGGFPAYAPEFSAKEHAADISSATSGHYEPIGQDHSYDVADARHEPMPSIQEEDSDKDSVYSDAAEDFSDGDGFGSINAIVHSPTANVSAARSTPPQSPIIPAPRRNVQEEASTPPAAWVDTEARWKDNVENAKRASLQPAAPIVENPQKQNKRNTYSQATNDRSKDASSSAFVAGGVQTLPPIASRDTIRTNAQPAIKKSMRGQTDEAPARTMRTQPRIDSNNEARQPLRSSMRATAVPAAVPATVSAPPPVQGTLQKKSLRTTAAPTQQRLPLVVDDSDSDSSFRRRRRARANNGGQSTMRKSMRSGATANSVPSAPSSQPARAMSPVERRPLSPAGGQQTMRTTLRGSMSNGPTLRGSLDDTPTLRGNQKPEKRSSSLFGRRKEAKSPTRPMSMLNGSKSRFAADSDDEPRMPKKAFKSRFGDSSDEDDDMRPVRGIPHNNRDGDSTDLDDSSDDEKTKRQSARAPVAPPPVLERPSSPMSIDGKKKRGFFGRMKKDKDEPSSPGTQSPLATTNGVDKSSKTKVKQNSESAALGFSSDAQKEALIEQTRQKLLTASNQPAAPVSPSPGKLQRRQTPQRIMSDSWPLPPAIPVSEEIPTRPFTSDGPATPTRPGLHSEQTSETIASSPTGSGSTLGKNGKKKRFPLLRKAFGLKD